MFKEFTAEVGEADGEVVREIERVTKKVIKDVNLVGVERTHFKVQHDKNGGYRAWVQLRYSVDESNKILMAEIKRNRQLNAKLQATQAFKELQDEIKGKQPESKEVSQVNTVAPNNGVDMRPVE